MSWIRGIGATLGVTALVVLLSAVQGVAGKKGSKEPSAIDLYKANCKTCHAKGSEDGEYTPMTLIADQWTRFFDKKYEGTHKDLTFPEKQEGIGGKKLSDILTPEVLKKLKKFCVDHAADSERPMTCG